MHRRTIVFLVFVVLAPPVTSLAQQPGNIQGNDTESELKEAERLSTRAVELYERRMYGEALVAAKQALETRERLLGKDDELVANALVNAAEIQRALGAAHDAKALFERALRIYERRLGLEDPKVCRVLDSLGMVYYSLHEQDETERTYKRLLKIREKNLNPEDPNLAKAISRLVEFYQFEGEYKKAEPLYERLIAIKEKQAAQSASLGEALYGYACLLRKTKREDEAEELEQRAAGLLNQFTEKDGPVRAGVLNGKARSLPRPDYPEAAQQLRIAGTVVVRVLIEESGKVMRACAVSGPRELMKPAESAAYGARFTRTTINGKAMKVTGVIEYHFVIDNTRRYVPK